MNNRKTHIGGYTLLKFIAAFQVFFLHVVTHLGLEQFSICNIPVISKVLSPFQGVPIFFVLSGYFIWKSLSARNISIKEYITHRFTRIFPELWIVVGLTALAVSIFEFKHISLGAFAAWIITQSTVMQFWTPDCLRSFGVGCPNGALWTITVFVQFYIVVFLLHKALHNKRIFAWGGVLLLCILANVLPGLVQDRLPETLYKLYQQTVFPYLLVFMYGAFIAEFENAFSKIIQSKWVTVILYIILAAGIPFDLKGAGYAVFRTALVAVFAISFGYTVKCNLIHQDISYELYLVHMPILNVFLELGSRKNWITFFCVLGVTLILSVILYHINQTIIRWSESRVKQYIR